MISEMLAALEWALMPFPPRIASGSGSRASGGHSVLTLHRFSVHAMKPFAARQLRVVWFATRGRNISRRSPGGETEAMVFATRNEIEYLNSRAEVSEQNPVLVREMCRRLDALRRYDQHFCDADWRPDRSGLQSRNGRRPR
jgi:hypothetical protein